MTREFIHTCMKQVHDTNVAGEDGVIYLNSNSLDALINERDSKGVLIGNPSWKIIPKWQQTERTFSFLVGSTIPEDVLIVILGTEVYYFNTGSE